MAKSFKEYLQSKIAANPKLADLIEEESVNSRIAQQIFDLRNSAGLSQKALADLIDTQQSVISRLEDADYDSHSLSVLRRIAKALGKKLRVEFYEDKQPDSPTNSATTVVSVGFTPKRFDEYAVAYSRPSSATMTAPNVSNFVCGAAKLCQDQRI